MDFQKELYALLAAFSLPILIENVQCTWYTETGNTIRIAKKHAERSCICLKNVTPFI